MDIYEGAGGSVWGYDRDENINNGSQMILSKPHISLKPNAKLPGHFLIK